MQGPRRRPALAFWPSGPQVCRVVLLLMTGCSPAQAPPDPDPAAPDGLAAVRLHLGCVLYWSEQLDDGKMSDEALAQLVVPNCRDLHLKSLQAVTPPDWTGSVEAQAQALEFDHTLAAVKWHRGGPVPPG